MFTFSVLVNCSSLERLLKCVQTCKTIYCSSTTDRHVHKSYEKMKKWFSELGSLLLLEEEEPVRSCWWIWGRRNRSRSVEIEGSTPVPVPNETEKEHMSSMTWKPFAAYFKLIKICAYLSWYILSIKSTISAKISDEVAPKLASNKPFLEQYVER